MSDSFQATFIVDAIDDDNAINTNLRTPNEKQTWSKIAIVMEDDDIKSIKSLNNYGFGLTKAKNYVTAVLDSNGHNPFAVIAYDVSINTPASFVGNNALIEPLVYLSAIGGKSIVQKTLLLKGVSVDAVKRISLRQMKFTSVTLTFLFKFPTYSDALTALDLFTAHARMLYCHNLGLTVTQSGRRVPRGKKNNVKQEGEAPELTTYVNTDPDFHLTAYVKPGKRGSAYAVFDSQEDADRIYAESETCVRIEIMLSSSWLAQHDLESPLAWKGKEGVVAYQLAFDELRSRLRVNDKLRRNEPQDRHLQHLSSMATAVLQLHLAGGNPYQHPYMTANRGQNSTSIYREILDKLHIELDIPWLQQRGHAYPKLGDWLSWDNRYKVPEDLAQLSMVKSTLTDKLKLLKAEVRQLMNQQQQPAMLSQHGKAQKQVVSTGKATKDNSLLTSIKRRLCVMRENALIDDETSDISNLLG